ncbi:hypothetical protein ABZP36_012566 [Zizania latifolia]
MWYASIPSQTVVWVVNRQDPVLNTPTVTKLSANGRIIIVDGQNATEWSSPMHTINVTGASAAWLHDNDNFIVSSYWSFSPESVAWQNFDYPTATLLPGMKLGVDIKKDITRNITSWRSRSDLSLGTYTFKLILSRLLEFFLFQGPTIIYASGPYNGAVLTGVPDLRSQDFTFIVVSSRDETYYSYSIRDPSLLSRFVVDATVGLV